MYSSETVFRFAPDIYEDNETMLAIYDAQKGELNRYQAIIQRVFLNNLVKYCNVEGIRRFEDIFHIQADELTESLDFRKARIINKFNQLPPFTRIFVEQMLQNVFGTGNWDFQVGQSDTDLINHYTKVNNPTISEDGIAISLNSSNYITLNNITLGNEWELTYKIIWNTATRSNSSNILQMKDGTVTFQILNQTSKAITSSIYGMFSSTKYISYIADGEVSQFTDGNVILINLKVNNNTLYYTVYKNGTLFKNNSIPSITNNIGTLTEFAIGKYSNSATTMPIDLKDFKITRNDYIIYQAAERNPFIAEIMLESDIQGLIAETFKDLRQIIPANIDIREIIYYPYVHGYLKRHYTHEEMQQFTHGDLKNG